MNVTPSFTTMCVISFLYGDHGAILAPYAADVSTENSLAFATTSVSRRTVKVLSGLLVDEEVFLRNLFFMHGNQLPILVLILGRNPDISI